MNGSRGRETRRQAWAWALAALVLGPGVDAQAPIPLPADLLLQQGWEAYRKGDRAGGLNLFMEVILQNPSHTEARGALRQVAHEAAEWQIRRVQEERRAVLEEAKENFERFKRRRAYAWLIEDMDRGEVLKAYDFLYGILEETPEDPWTEYRLREVQRIVLTMSRQIEERGKRYAAAARGFYFYTLREWPKARKEWLAALSLSGTDIPEPRIRKYLASIGAESQERPQTRTRRVPSPQEEKARTARQAEEYYVSGIVRYGMGDVRGAVELWSRALELDSGHERARRALKRARAELED